MLKMCEFHGESNCFCIQQIKYWFFVCHANVTDIKSYLIICPRMLLIACSFYHKNIFIENSRLTNSPGNKWMRNGNENALGGKLTICNLQYKLNCPFSFQLQIVCFILVILSNIVLKPNYSIVSSLLDVMLQGVTPHKDT